MRPGQNKRMRGRNNNNNNRKGPNPLTRSYESNGPDVKIRGTAHHIGEKYLQLARDAQSSGDPVMAESYLQHAEHYFRLIAAAQQAQQQAQFGYQRQPGEPQAETEEEDADDDFAALPDRFASPSERQPQPPQQVPQPYGGQPFSDRQPYQPRQDNQRQDNQRQDNQRQDNQERHNQPRHDNDQPRQDQPRYGDRQQGDRQPYEHRGDRPYDNRRDRNYQDRGDRGGQDRGGQDRGGQDRSGQDRGDRPPRGDYDNRGFRGRNRDFRGDGPPREAREPRQGEEQPGNGLPAFITGPSRAPQDNEPQPSEPQGEAPHSNSSANGEAGDESGFHMRPRRRRRPKGEFPEDRPEREGGPEHQATSASDPVGD